MTVWLALQDAVASTRVEDLTETLRLLDLPPRWVVVLVILPFFAAVTWLGYAKETLGRGARTTLMSLRVLSFALLLLVLARPVRVEQREDPQPAEVLLLLDDSASMRRRDTYTGDQPTRDALALASGGSPTELTRLDLTRLVLEKELLPLLERGEYQARLLGFSEGVTTLADADALSGRGSGTHVGSALTQALSGIGGRNVTDVVVLSDGRSNGGVGIEEAAAVAFRAGVPIHTLVVGDTRAEKNAIVELVEASGEALEGDELAVTVRIRGRGAEDVHEVDAVLEELDEDGDVLRPVYEERVALTEDGERVVLVAPSSDAGLRSGERRFRVSVPRLPGETMTDDNSVEFSVHVSPARMRVLYVDGYPRWEYRYLKNLLLRADRNLDVQCYLLSATPDFPQESSRGLPPLRRIPTTRRELLDAFDVVILGDVDPNQISHSEAEVEEFLSSLRQFVEAGGGLLFQAGEYYNPRAYLNTPLKDVLPVVLDPTGVLAFAGDTQREFRAVLEDPASPHEILRLNPDAEINRLLWEDDEEGLRGFYWYSPVDRAKPGAHVLLRHPTDISPQTGDAHPLLVIGYYPAGRTLFLAVDSTWMWRFHYGDRYHETFWRNAIRWLALGRLKSGDRRYRIETSRATYDLEDRILLEARVLDEDFRPSKRASQIVRWSGPDGRETELELALAPDRDGLYRGSLQVGRPGLYHVWMSSADKPRVSATEFEVVLPSRENADPSPDPEALALLSKKTGGRALGLGGVRDLSREFPGDEERREPISSRLEDAWDRLATLLLALGLLSAEWILRKRFELV